MKPEAIFTEFKDGTNWTSGVVSDGETTYVFCAQLFDVGSICGIKNGRVSKLQIYIPDYQYSHTHPLMKETIMSFDRGWDMKPSKLNKPFYAAVMNLLKSAPKRKVVA